MKTASASFAVLTALAAPTFRLHKPGNSTITLGELSASGQTAKALHTENVLTSVDVLGGIRLKDKNVMNSWQCWPRCLVSN
jgi:iron complex outermembrane receptor protein